MKRNCLPCLMRRLQAFVSLTNDFSKITCRHSKKCWGKPTVENSRTKQYLVLILQVFVFFVAIYDFLVNILKNIHKDLLSILVGLGFLFDTILMEFVIVHSINWDQKVISLLQECIRISEYVRHFDKSSYFEKWFWLPCFAFLPHFLVFFINEVIYLWLHEVNMVTVAKLTLRSVMGK